MSRKFGFSFFFLGFLIFNSFCQVNNQTKYKMFCKAIDNSASTNQLYIVINVKNSNTNEIKEICTPSICLYLNYFSAHIADLKSVGDSLKTNKERFFEFSNDSILSELNFFLYSTNELQQFEKLINISSVLNDIKTGKFQNVTQYCGQDSKKWIMFVHVLFNYGVLIKQGCWTTNGVFDSFYEDSKN